MNTRSARGCLFAIGVVLAGCAGASTTTADAPASSAPNTTVTSATSAGSTSTPASKSAGASTTNPPATASTAVAVSSPSTSGASTTTAAAPGTIGSQSATTVAELMALKRPIVLGHAGGEDQHPHSTPYAFAESIREGVDMLDMDVQLSKDGVLVVQHDDTVDRTTNGTGKVADMTYDELAKLDNAYWFTTDCTCTGKPDSAYILRGMRTGGVPPLSGYTPDDFIIPRFRDIVTRFPKIPLNIEIKGSGEAALPAAKELAKELTELGRLDAAVVTSFDDTVVTAFHNLAPTVEMTPGLSVSAAWVLSHTPVPDGMRILQLPPTFQNITVITPAMLKATHAAGYVVWIWPNDHALENPTSYLKFLKEGIDGLNINYPDQGVAAVKTFLGQLPTGQ